jgi:hypothetical protein
MCSLKTIASPARSRIRARRCFRIEQRLVPQIIAAQLDQVEGGEGLPLGYRMKDGKIAVVEDEAERVRQIYRG